MAKINEVAAQLMEHMCTHKSHGYTQGNRWGNGKMETITIDGKGYKIALGDRDCSSGVISAYKAALVGTKYEGKLDGATYTGNMRRVFTRSGLFKVKPMSFTAQRGDIYLNDTAHTAMCTHAYGSSKGDILAEFAIAETGGIYGHEGDQTGNESHIRSYYNYPWNCILHYIGTGEAGGSTSKPATQTKLSIKFRVSTDSKGKSWLGENVTGNGKPIRWLAIKMPGWYQVRTTKNGWLPAVRGYNINNLDRGCAGDGSPILDVRCYYETQNPASTGWYSIKYRCKDANEKYLAWMRDTTSTDGSSDNFAGDADREPIVNFEAKLVKN